GGTIGWQARAPDLGVRVHPQLVGVGRAGRDAPHASEDEAVGALRDHLQVLLLLPGRLAAIALGLGEGGGERDVARLAVFQVARQIVGVAPLDVARHVALREPERMEEQADAAAPRIMEAVRYPAPDSVERHLQRLAVADELGTALGRMEDDAMVLGVLRLYPEQVSIGGIVVQRELAGPIRNAAPEYRVLGQVGYAM